MYMTVSIQVTPVGKLVITHITDIRTLSSMYVTMSIQPTPVDKGLNTHITEEKTLSSMYMTMISQRLLLLNYLSHTLEM
jgi:hypothetical protein